MSEIATPRQEPVLTRVDATGDPLDSRTASESGGVVSNEDSCLETFGSLRCVLPRGHSGVHASAKADVDAMFGYRLNPSPLPWTLVGGYAHPIEAPNRLVNVAGQRGPLPVARIVDHKDVSGYEKAANAEYIVTACNAYPALIAERDALRDQIAQMTKALIFASAHTSSDAIRRVVDRALCAPTAEVR